ncbi:type IV toxin-antitoxin system AbiEi family antitoxin domain-containing protein [Patulibacter sp. SYSU D01012]|uniref:type IV toxin-antitoxin system AbiEi family antitoxin domain-containing protein n=1 Tax=Patulibacter sp. SYSU D01012 TaxID=2817381 RepID=UPI001B308C4F|nr:type IV toxin-antitoxin system AbiEi family antitoxin domain-containing protein [Patulibacter sp. SYSU D01012]
MSSPPPLLIHPAPPASFGADQRVAWLAGRQLGLVTRDQLLHLLGLTRHQIAGRIARGLLIPVHRTVYALGVRPATPEARAMAAVLACGDGAMASHATAAALHGMLPWRRGPVHVTTPPSTRRVAGIAVHVSHSGPSVGTTRLRVPCTADARTLIDVAGSDGAAPARRAWSSLAGQRRLRPRMVEHELRLHSGRRGTALVREMLERHRLATTGHTKSELEAAALQLCAAHGLPLPAVNRLVVLQDGTYEADMSWAEARLVVELDGWATHRSPEQFEDDRHRDFDFELAGWSSVRLTWTAVTAQAEATARRLRRRLAVGRESVPTDLAPGQAGRQ